MDTTAPALTVPAPVIVNATGPDGATVSYTASATDTVDPAPTVLCDPPSGTVFAAGDTTVQCSATDASGNSSAPASFVVHVKGASEQLQDLSATVAALPGPDSVRNGLEANLRDAQRSLARGKLPVHAAASTTSSARSAPSQESLLPHQQQTLSSPMRPASRPSSPVRTRPLKAHRNEKRWRRASLSQLRRRRLPSTELCDRSEGGVEVPHLVTGGHAIFERDPTADLEIRPRPPNADGRRPASAPDRHLGYWLSAVCRR